jgi:hypothetical protein
VDLGLHVRDGLGQAFHVVGVRLEDVEGDTLRGLGADPGQTPEFVHEVLDDTLVHGQLSLLETASRHDATTHTILRAEAAIVGGVHLQRGDMP